MPTDDLLELRVDFCCVTDFTFEEGDLSIPLIFPDPLLWGLTNDCERTSSSMKATPGFLDWAKRCPLRVLLRAAKTPSECSSTEDDILRLPDDSNEPVDWYIGPLFLLLGVYSFSFSMTLLIMLSSSLGTYDKRRRSHQMS